MSKPTFYYLNESPPCRTVMAIARILGIDMEMKLVNLKEKEQLKPEFLKINPFHQVPTFVDTDGFIMSESRAICMYLIESRKPDSELYPRGNLKKRAQIDRWLHYDCGTFFMTIRAPLVDRILLGGPNEFRINYAKDQLKTLNEALAPISGKFLVDDTFTLADVSMYFSANLIEVMPDYDMEEYPHIKAWYHKTKEELKKYDNDGIFEKAIDMMKKYLDGFKIQN